MKKWGWKFPKNLRCSYSRENDENDSVKSDDQRQQILSSSHFDVIGRSKTQEQVISVVKKKIREENKAAEKRKKRGQKIVMTISSETTLQSKIKK